MNWITFHLHVQKGNTNKRIQETEGVIEGEEDRHLEKVMSLESLEVKIKSPKVKKKSNSQGRKIGLKDENNLATLIEAEGNLRKIGEMANETNMEIRKNHILAIEALEVGIELVGKIDQEEEDLLETEEEGAEINLVTNLQEIEEETEIEGVEDEANMVTEMEEITTEAETLGKNLTQAKNSMAERKVLVKSENLKIRVREITNVNLNNYSKV